MALSKGNKGVRILPNRTGTDEPYIELYYGSTTYNLIVEETTGDIVIKLGTSEVGRFKQSGTERFVTLNDKSLCTGWFESTYLTST